MQLHGAKSYTQEMYSKICVTYTEHKALVAST